MKIKHKLSLGVFVAGVVIIGIISMVYYYHFIDTTTKRHLDLLQADTDRIAANIDNLLIEKTKTAVALGHVPLVLNTLFESNRAMERLDADARRMKIESLNTRWMKADNALGPFVQRYLSNPVARYLKDQQKRFQKEYGEIFITNRYGVLTASTAKLTTLAHAHKYWWKAAYNEGKGAIFFDDRGYDDSVGDYVLGVVVPIWRGPVLAGVLKCNLNILGAINAILRESQGQRTATLQLARSGGLIVTEKDKQPLSTRLTAPVQKKLEHRIKGTMRLQDEPDRFLAFAPVKVTTGKKGYGFGGSVASIDHEKGNKGEIWYVIQGSLRAEAMAPVKATAQLLFGTGVTVAFLLGAIALFMGRAMAKPIQELVEAVKEVGKGRFEKTIDIEARDEVGKLARSFNTMVTDLKHSTASRKELQNEIRIRKQTEKALQESQAILKAAMDNSQAGIAIADAPDGKLRYVNDSGLGIRGRAKEEIVNGVCLEQYASSWEILHFDGTPYEKDEVPLARAILYGEVCSDEFIIRRSDNEDRVVWANAAPVKNDQGEIIAGIVVFLDITNRKQAERENKINRIRLDISHKMATMPEATEKVVNDYVLNKMLELTGSRIGFLGFLQNAESTMEVHAWSESAMAQCDIQNKPLAFPVAQAGIWGEPVRTRKPVIINDYNAFHPAKKGCPEGHVRIFRFMAVPVFESRRIVAVAAVGNKQTPYETIDSQQLILLMESWWEQILRRRLDQDRQKLQAQIRQAQKIESLGNLAGGIAHDFNNILFPIMGMSEMLLEDLDANSIEYENAQEILTASKRGRDLVNQILAFSRQSNRKTLPVRIQQVLKEVLNLSRSSIPSYIDINHNIQSDCGLVMADPTQIHQVAMNLITNAYHAVEEAGSGSISVQLKETRRQHAAFPVKRLEPGPYVILSVSDTGCGIDKNRLEKIFEPYYTTKTQGKGTGLGLAVVHGIVKEHKGDISVVSRIGQGTTVNVYLPLLEKSAEAVSIQQNNALKGGGESILVVDDEAAVAKLEMRMLERCGYQVTMHTSCIDALAAFKANPDHYDLVVTDMTMPNMTGDQFARELIAKKPDIPIIMCTGFSERINEDKAVAIGIKGFLIKPVVKSELARMVRNVLDKR